MDVGTAVLCGLVAVGLAALSAAVAGAGVGVRRLLLRRRQRGLRQWAERNGWTYAETPHTDWRAGLPGGDIGEIRHVVSGTVEGRAVTVGEYAYSFTSRSLSAHAGRYRQRRQFVVAAVRLAHRYPAFAVHRRHDWSKARRSLLGDNEPVLRYEPFDRQYRIVADNPADNPRWLSPPVVNQHVHGRAPLWSLQETELLVYREGRIHDTRRIPEAAREAVRMAQFLGLR